MNEIWPTDVVSRNDKVFEAFPDMLLHNGVLYCSYLVTEQHQVSKRVWSRIDVRTSTDAGRTWSDAQTVTEAEGEYTLNTSSLGVHDGNLFALVDHITKDDSGRIDEDGQFICRFDLDGDEWTRDTKTVKGMIPSNPIQMGERIYMVCQYDRITVHGRVCANVLVELTERTSKVLPFAPGRVLCEGSLTKLGDSLMAATFRDDTGIGHPAYKMMISEGDGDPSVIRMGETTLLGCHRPRVGELDYSRLLATYRFIGMHTRDRNTFGAVLRSGGFASLEAADEKADIFPIHCDTAPNGPASPDQGYTAWQVVGDELLVANYVMNDAPKAYIALHRIPMDYINQRGTLSESDTGPVGSAGIAKEQGQ